MPDRCQMALACLVCALIIIALLGMWWECYIYQRNHPRFYACVEVQHGPFGSFYQVGSFHTEAQAWRASERFVRRYNMSNYEIHVEALDGITGHVE